MDSDFVEIDLPFPKELSAQNRGGWQKQQKVINDLRLMAKMIALEATGSERPNFQEAIVQYEFFVPDRVRRDEGNLIYQCKPFVDGCVDAGIIAGDHWEVLSTGKVRTELRKGNPGVRLTFFRKLS